ncbi:hypothetical protein DVDV_0778 [Desulfovibrio sp. DV]|nr:hypothetical protein [Desulfovibrio sp. DV]OLN30176.1 hypothetical protein DVDV_0778 [Desulfovibrio sp. DV]
MPKAEPQGLPKDGWLPKIIATCWVAKDKLTKAKSTIKGGSPIAKAYGAS